MQSQGSGVPESRYTMNYSHTALSGDGVDLYGHGQDPYILQHQHHIGHGGPPGLSPTGHIGMGSPGQHHQHSSKRSADVAGLNLKQDPMVGDVTMSTIGMGHSTMDDGGSGSGGGQNGSQTKKTPPPNGKKTKGRVKIKMEFIDNKLRRYTTFSKRKTGIMKKAYELSTLTGTQVMLLVASETGHVYTFATRKLQPMITSEAGKALIQTCLNSPDPPSSTIDQRMSATGFEETELTYTLHDEDQKVRQMMYTGHIPPTPSHSHALSSHQSSSHPSPHGHGHSHGGGGGHHSHAHSHPGLLGPPLGPGPSSNLSGHHVPSPYASHGSPSPGPSSHLHHVHSSQHQYVQHGLSSPGSGGSGHLTLSPAPTPQPQHSQGR